MMRKIASRWQLFGSSQYYLHDEEEEDHLWTGYAVVGSHAFVAWSSDLLPQGLRRPVALSLVLVGDVVQL
jgi:hypothetical protein